MMIMIMTMILQTILLPPPCPPGAAPPGQDAAGGHIPGGRNQDVDSVDGAEGVHHDPLGMRTLPRLYLRLHQPHRTDRGRLHGRQPLPGMQD